MADALEQLRSATEADLAQLMGKLGPSQRRALRDAIDRYGSVAAVPESVWEGLKQEIDEQAASLMLLLLMGTYRITGQRIGRGATAEQRRQIGELADDEERLRVAVAAPAATMGRRVADEYIDGVRNRLENSVDAKADELNSLPPREASRRVADEIESAVGEDAGEATAVTNTTRAITAGQESAAGDVSRRLRVDYTTTWVTERDAKVCPICRPLDGKNANDWDAVLATGGVSSDALAYIQASGGPPAHPNCRCRLTHTIAPESDN